MNGEEKYHGWVDEAAAVMRINGLDPAVMWTEFKRSGHHTGNGFLREEYPHVLDAFHLLKRTQSRILTQD